MLHCPGDSLHLNDNDERVTGIFVKESERSMKIPSPQAEEDELLTASKSHPITKCDVEDEDGLSDLSSLVVLTESSASQIIQERFLRN